MRARIHLRVSTLRRERAMSSVLTTVRGALRLLEARLHRLVDASARPCALEACWRMR
jgi:hypothetical protein